MPAWLHGQQAITMISSFQLTRTTRLTWHTRWTRIKKKYFRQSVPRTLIHA